MRAEGGGGQRGGSDRRRVQRDRGGQGRQNRLRAAWAPVLALPVETRFPHL